MKRRTLMIGLGALATLASVVAATMWNRPDAAPAWQTAEVVRASLEATVSASGSLKPVDQVDVGSAVSGRILHLRADYNSRVRAGQVLAEIDPSAFRARVEQFAAGATRAKATLQQAEFDLRRQQQLSGEHLVAEADLERALTARDQAKADVQQVEAQLASARVDLANTMIRAPIDGVVLSRQVDEGQTVAASLQAPTLFQIARDLADMQVETSVDEADIGRVRIGQAVRFSVDAYPGEYFAGTVRQVRLQSTTTSGVVTYTVIIHTRNELLRLRPGMTADVTIRVARSDSALVVPNAALRVTAADLPNAPSAGSKRAPGDSLVFVVRARGPEGVSVHPGITDGTSTAVSGEGLAAGDRVITQVATGSAAPARATSPLGGFGPPSGLGKKRS